MLLGTLAALIARGIGKPGFRSHGYTRHEWDISGSCQKPVTRELHARPLTVIGRSYAYGRGSEKPLGLILHTRCRMCEACMRLRASQWTYRAISETRDAARTWFGTLTLRPESHYQMLARARRRLWSGGTDFDKLSEAEQFQERMTEISREVTLYLKRVRKESGARVRFLLVAETHKSGLPHLHILVHEMNVEQSVRYATLASQWKLGFVNFKLARDTKTAAYICKYISKSLLARVRASLRYGLDRENTALSDRNADEANREKKTQKEGEVKVIEQIPRMSENEEGAFQHSLTDHSGGKKNDGIVKCSKVFEPIEGASSYQSAEIQQPENDDFPGRTSTDALAGGERKQTWATCALPW